MRIAVNGFIDLKGISGSSRGATLVKDALSDHRHVVPVAPPSHSGSRVRKFIRMVAWDTHGAARMASESGSNIVVHTANTGGAGQKLRSVVIIHDTMVLDHPKMFDIGFVAYARLMFGYSAKRATKIVTPSHHSRRQILRRWPQADVEVIPWPPYQELNSVPKMRDQRSNSVLVVSSVDKHKRLPLAVSTVARAREAGVDLNLILVTRPGNDEAALEQAISRFDPDRDWINVRSAVSDQELQNLYETSFCLLVPSLDEGFCLPALEGARCGTPVVHADRGALPEVVSSDYSATRDSLAPQRRIARASDNDSNDEALLSERLQALASPADWKTASEHAVRQTRQFTQNRFRKEWETLIAGLER